MSSTRASKRRKHSSNDAERAHLARLNGLPVASFRQQHIPPEWLLLRSNSRSVRNNASSPPLSKQQHALAFYSARALPSADFRRCFALLRQTSEAHYRRSARGWDPAGKKAEMLEDNMRYLIVCADGGDGDGASDGNATTPSSSPGGSSRADGDGGEGEDVDDFGFLSFMLDEDDEVEDRLVLMLYVYEVHLGRNLRGLGLGRHLMNLAEHVARSTGMHKVELSVHSGNEAAERFYRRLGFETDETSPAPRELRGRKSIKPEWCVLSLPVSAMETKEQSPARPRKAPKRIKPTLLSGS
jgi:N-alpha-acetyltransferase 40